MVENARPRQLLAIGTRGGRATRHGAASTRAPRNFMLSSRAHATVRWNAPPVYRLQPRRSRRRRAARRGCTTWSSCARTATTNAGRVGRAVHVTRISRRLAALARASSEGGTTPQDPEPGAPRGGRGRRVLAHLETIQHNHMLDEEGPAAPRRARSARRASSATAVPHVSHAEARASAWGPGRIYLMMAEARADVGARRNCARTSGSRRHATRRASRRCATPLRAKRNAHEATNVFSRDRRVTDVLVIRCSAIAARGGRGPRSRRACPGASTTGRIRDRPWRLSRARACGRAVLGRPLIVSRRKRRRRTSHTCCPTSLTRRR